MKVQKIEMALAIKAKDMKDAFTAVIRQVRKVQTTYGEKLMLNVLPDGEEEGVGVFVNAFSLSNLIDGFGNETDEWEGKIIKLDTETSDRTIGQKSIIIEPVVKSGK